MCNVCFNFEQICILPTQCIYMFRMILTIHSHYFREQNEPSDLPTGDAVKEQQSRDLDTQINGKWHLKKCYLG
jgi:hypothetical protein